MVVENILRISRKIWKTKAFSDKCDSSKDLYVHLYLYKKIYANGRSRKFFFCEQEK